MKGTEMTVLSYRARRFIRHNLSWHNIRFQWTVVGLGIYVICFILGRLLNLAIGEPFDLITGLPIMLVGIAGAVTFWHTAYVFPLPTKYPWVVRKYEDLRDWWSKVSEPARIGTFEGRAVLERWVFGDFRYIYNYDGRLVATEQIIDWSSTDPDWRVGDPEDVERCVTHFDGSERLSWLARLRSPKLPAGNQADILDHNNEVLGQTTYTIS
jgi:hypothetical protein